MNLGMELERDVSPATYLWDRRIEFPAFADGSAVEAAIQTGLALENWQLAEARRKWRVVIETACEAGRAARNGGVPTRRLISDIDRVLDAVELVLFDGRLPADVAARAARSAARMCARVVEHVLRSYWEESELVSGDE
ncbi:MAG: hypothetical protein GWN99_19205 [Gemmatimonadetes bacterium]|uniref:Uncharacterized protein n=1 Tax=Candidatus Kutchimonas denitrificans TaxID=3056748 RepID=A0AAE4Z4T0_9BACT|nr:hypothetical protein [Gemmatimonadota bacterium]NIR73794.1 hypothetical protein [Candidatus Kutchimonas denitrificans]NIS03158.1 hypothetical protein [Gemmatimonadota bacterium]NIT69059.1 hypothetical protein [Gemmatimonadota bacterium]NIU54150.1 hypothetical protein [Gemmatimonadota bacterium]